jgi:hypothetical protein
MLIALGIIATIVLVWLIGYVTVRWRWGWMEDDLTDWR